MQAFWKRLLRADARRLLGASAVFLALACVWWLWKALAPPGREDKAMSSIERASSASLGILSFLDDQRSTAGESAGNPFLFPKDSALPRRIPTRRRPESEEATTADSRPTPQQQKTVSLTYHGWFQRPDGTTVALVEDSRSKSRRFYKPGDVIPDAQVRIAEIVRTNLVVEPVEGDKISILTGQSENFDNGRHTR